MLKFLKNTALFLCFAIVIICLLQALISFRIKGKSVTGYDTLDVTFGLNADLVLMGSSRCWAHFEPKFFEDTYQLKTVNIGVNGHSELTASILRLENYLAKNKPPKFAIFSFDPLITPGSFDENDNFTNKNDYSRFAFLPSRENADFVNYFKFDASEKYIPLYALFKYQLFRDCVTLEKSSLFSEGFEGNNKQWDTVKIPVSDVMKKYFIKNSQIKQLKKQLNELKTLCGKNNIRLIFIQTPVYKSVYNRSGFEKSATIAKSVGIPFIDVSSSPIRHDIRNFYNSAHLNKNGIDQMNKLLKNEKQLTAFFKINP